MNNSAYVGGATYIDSGNISSITDYYMSNTADSGGAIYVYSGDIFSSSDQYINNSADSGGVIYVSSGNISSTSDQYINNRADSDGGAIGVNYSHIISSTSDYYINKKALKCKPSALLRDSPRPRRYVAFTISPCALMSSHTSLHAEFAIS